MSENEKLREALEAWSKSIIMSDGEREIPIADIWAGYGGDVQHAAKLTREALSTPPSKVDEEVAWLIERRVAPPQWSIDANPTGVGAFYSDIHRAHRFATKTAAETAMRRMAITPQERGEYFVSEHIWVAPSKSPGGAPSKADVAAICYDELTTGPTERGAAAKRKADADDVERVALALMNHERGRFNMPELEWSEFTTVDKALGLDKARAALFAIQNRDAGLREALKAVFNDEDFCCLGQIARSRVRAALQMGGEKP